MYRSGDLKPEESYQSLTSPLSALAAKALDTSRHKLQNGWSTLNSDLPQAGFDNIHSDVVASDRVAEARVSFSMNSIAAYRAILSTYAGKGMPGAPTVHEVRDV